MEASPLHFRSRHRVQHEREFDAIYAARVRKQRGPIVVSTLPNALDHPRLGLSVGTRVGNAVVRNRCKRLIREAFRHEQHALARSLTGGYDIVVGVRSSPRKSGGGGGGVGRGEGEGFVPLAALRRVLVELVGEADAEWRRRSRRAGTSTDHVGPQEATVPHTPTHEGGRA